MNLFPDYIIKKIKQDKYLYLILAFAVIFKIVTVQMIGTDGDSGHAWINAKHIAYGGPFSPTHISTRMGIILPAVFCIKLFGSNPLVYYIAPFIFYILSAVYSYKLIKFVSGSEKTAFWTVFLLCCFPNVIDSGNQLKTEIFSIALVVMSVYYLFKYIENENKFFYLVISSLILFWAYLAKETNILFMPWMVLVVLIRQKKLKNIFIFSLILFTLFIAETLVYRFIYEAPLGRLSIISTSALDKDVLQPVKTVFHLFLRFTAVRPFWYPLFIIGLPGMLYVFLREKNNRYLRELIIITGGFFLLLTFAVKSVFPLIPAMPFIERYFDVVLPFLFMILVILFKYILVKMKLVSSSFKFHLLFIVFILISGSIAYQYLYLKVAYPGLEGSFLKNYPLKEVIRFHKIINDAYDNGIPVITPKTEPLRYKRPYDRVNDLVSSGLDLSDACDKTGITVNYYNYCKTRVTDGDYKSWLSFKYFFIDYDKIVKNRINVLPAFNIVEFKEWKYGVIIDNMFYDGTAEGASDYLQKSKNYIWMDVTPFRVKVITNK